MAEIRRKARAQSKKSSTKKKKKKTTNQSQASRVLAAVKKKKKTITQGARTLAADDPILSDVREWISTGFPTLDKALGGGWPVGRASEVWGKEATGKTALAHMAIREAQRKGGFGVLYDYEVAVEQSKIEGLGIDLENVIYSIPDHMEQGFDFLNAFLDQLEAEPPDAPVMIVWDSVAMAKTKEQIEKGGEELTVASQARVMSNLAASHKLKKKISRCRAHVLFVNQPRQKIGANSFEDPETTPGGSALNFLADLRVQTKRIATLPKSGNPKYGYLMKGLSRKNKVVPPHRSGEFYVDFEYGPSRALTQFELLRQEKKIEKAKGKYRLTGVEAEFEGTREDFATQYQQDKKLRKSVDEAVAARA